VKSSGVSENERSEFSEFDDEDVADGE